MWSFTEIQYQLLASVWFFIYGTNAALKENVWLSIHWPGLEWELLCGLTFNSLYPVKQLLTYLSWMHLMYAFLSFTVLLTITALPLMNNYVIWQNCFSAALVTTLKKYPVETFQFHKFFIFKNTWNSHYCTSVTLCSVLFCTY